MQNYGVIIDQQPKDFIAGVNSPLGILGINPSGDWTKWLPSDERQGGVYFDSQACVSFSATNVIETILNHLKEEGKLHPLMVEDFKRAGYFDSAGKFNFSDRALAKMSGTTQSGNSLNKVAETIRNYGLIPESKWAWDSAQRTPVFDWDDFYAEIPQEIQDLGKIFKKWVRINWEWVVAGTPDLQRMKDRLVDGPLQIAAPVCPGWFTDNPVPKCDLPIAHATEIFRIPSTVSDYDSYAPYIKELAPDYPIPWALRYLITLIPPMFQLVKEEGSPAVYLETPLGQYYAIADGEEVPGGDLLKSFSGSYGNAGIKHVPAGSIDKSKIVGDIKAHKF